MDLTAQTAPTPGIKTLSFWMALLSAITTSILASDGFPPQYRWIVGIVSSSLAMMGFVAGRKNVQEAHEMPAPNQVTQTTTTTVTVPPATPPPP